MQFIDNINTQLFLFMLECVKFLYSISRYIDFSSHSIGDTQCNILLLCACSNYHVSCFLPLNHHRHFEEMPLHVWLSPCMYLHSFMFFLQVSRTWFPTHTTSKLPLTSRGCRCTHFAVLLKRTVFPGALIFKSQVKSN